MKAPPMELEAIFKAAAVEHAIPWTLLAAIAFKESAYNVKAVGPKTQQGWHAQGLMQLSPANAEAYKVDPFKPAEAVHGACRLIVNLFRAGDHDMGHVIAAYNWGIANVNKALETKTAFPRKVRQYVAEVQANRKWLQDRVQAKGDTINKRLTNAVIGLRSANPEFREVRQLFETFGTWQKEHGITTALLDSDFLEDPFLMAFWSAYARAYEMAPITDSKTPPPERIAPSWWAHVTTMFPAEPMGLMTWERSALSNAHVINQSPGEYVPPRVGPTATAGPGLFAIMVAFMLFWATSSSKQRRRAFGL